MKLFLIKTGMFIKTCPVRPRALFALFVLCAAPVVPTQSVEASERARLSAGLYHSNAAAGQKAGGRRGTGAARRRKLRKPDVIYVATPPETVDEMLRLARLEPDDVLYDLGSGDGRIPIAAAKQYGIRAVGIDIDHKLIEEANENARREGVEHLVSFRHEDMFRANLNGATVVTLYLSDRLNLLMRPKLLRDLRPGARIVSHDFTMGDWPPERSVKVPWKNLYRTVYVWTVPRNVRKAHK